MRVFLDSHTDTRNDQNEDEEYIIGREDAYRAAQQKYPHVFVPGHLQFIRFCFGRKKDAGDEVTAQYKEKIHQSAKKTAQRMFRQGRKPVIGCDQQYRQKAQSVELRIVF